MTEDSTMLEDVNPEPLSTLEELDDIADTVEAIVLNFAGEQQRNAYLVLANEFQSCVETLPEEPEQRTAEQNDRLLKLAARMTDAFKPLLEACPAHIRALHEAIRQAVDAEHASKA